MEERELTQRIKSLSKAIQSQEAPTVVINMLENLKKDSAPTEEQLRSTKAGVTIGKLRSNANRDIARVASEIVAKWKKNIDAQKDAKKQRTTMASNPSSSTPKSNSSPAPPSSAYNQPYQGDTEKRHFKTDQVDTKRTGDEARDNVIGVLYNGLAYRSTASIDAVMARAVELEHAAFRAHNGLTKEYRTRTRALFTALKRKDNGQLRQRVMAGEIAADKFVLMSDEELASDEQRKRDEALAKDNMMKAQVPMAEKSFSSTFKCSKCGEKKVSYTQAQTRSADEPMTTFCECTVCGNRWKFS
ncbi:hypothetical protein P8C59_002859 [Phyllachora maydis]|uniref:Transcription elongation factor n=1 Tax=Phyllachora maydis TaxID=1825666 RepID=A0AAD9HZH0_9PEZI|nr:hypothetical protein P8C59_002859 [Phyllachora maydis]